MSGCSEHCLLFFCSVALISLCSLFLFQMTLEKILEWPPFCQVIMFLLLVQYLTVPRLLFQSEIPKGISEGSSHSAFLYALSVSLPYRANGKQIISKE
jgi:cytosine/uracil/thiamine/allantoin permease